jgi:hypothetical protein
MLAHDKCHRDARIPKRVLHHREEALLGYERARGDDGDAASLEVGELLAQH